MIDLFALTVCALILSGMIVAEVQSAPEIARRTTCAANLRVIHSGMVSYAQAQPDRSFIPVKSTYPVPEGFEGDRPAMPAVLNAFTNYETDEGKMLQIAGLAGDSREYVDEVRNEARHTRRILPRPIAEWDCPSRDIRSTWEDNSSIAGITDWQLIVGYVSMSGVKEWVGPDQVVRPSRSPVTLHTARPGWVLAADFTKYGSFAAWRNPEIDRVVRNGNTPPHRFSTQDWRPALSNQVSVDGSVYGAELHELIAIHTWAKQSYPNFRQTFWYQADLGDYSPDPKHYADSLRQ